MILHILATIAVLWLSVHHAADIARAHQWLMPVERAVNWILLAGLVALAVTGIWR